MPAAKKGARAAKAANKITKPVTKSSTRRTSDRISASVGHAVQAGLEALVESPTYSPPNKARGPAARERGRRTYAAENVEMADQGTLASPPASDAVSCKPRATRGRPKKMVQEDVDEVADPPEPSGREAAQVSSKRGRNAIVSRKVEIEIPETQEESKEVDTENDEERMEDLPARQSSDPSQGGRQASVRPSAAQKRPDIPSFDGSEAGLRRRLGEMNQKCENLELKYRDLRDIAVREAERNFDRLRKTCEDKADTANELIASLKNELALQKEVAREGQRFKKQVEESDVKVEILQSKLNATMKTLAESKTEVKTLNMKLTAARTAEASAAAKVPGSAMKNSNARMAGKPEPIQQGTQAAQMKEDLYGDLTGLIVTTVKREGDEDAYDCLQTGKNGTLHFKLVVDHDAAAEGYDEAQFTYMPQLDANRDRALIEMLPDFLVEEITFPRGQVNKFYARVMKALTERIE